MGLHIVYVDLVPYFVGRINSHVSSSTRLASLKSQWMPVLSTLTTVQIVILSFIYGVHIGNSSVYAFVVSY
jgi:hypothetical protein